MNRLILIGNGFDLAHKMKTSYYDFIFHYIKESFLEAKSSGSFEDGLMRINRNGPVTIPAIESFGRINEFMTFHAPKQRYTIAVFPSTNYNNERESKEFSWKIKNNFIERIFLTCQHCGWVDIENEYYSELKDILENTDEKKKKEQIDALNSAFGVLKMILEKYISGLDIPPLNNQYHEYFQEQFKANEIVTRQLPHNGHIEQTLFLNFNYTSIIEQNYGGDSGTHKINYIHGKLNDKTNPIIFGFGDELDSDYSRIEAEKVKGFLNHVKSFDYFKTSNYHDLVRFIDSNDFQVYVFGHSCGLSDRTMLNMIFEHEKCVSIKIFYYKNGDKNNYSDLTQEISRHFRNKGIMRKKIAPFDKSIPMPQAT